MFRPSPTEDEHEQQQQPLKRANSPSVAIAEEEGEEPPAEIVPLAGIALPEWLAELYQKPEPSPGDAAAAGAAVEEQHQQNWTSFLTAAAVHDEIEKAKQQGNRPSDSNEDGISGGSNFGTMPLLKVKEEEDNEEASVYKDRIEEEPLDCIEPLRLKMSDFSRQRMEHHHNTPKEAKSTLRLFMDCHRHRNGQLRLEVSKPRERVEAEAAAVLTELQQQDEKKEEALQQQEQQQHQQQYQQYLPLGVPAVKEEEVLSPQQQPSIAAVIKQEYTNDGLHLPNIPTFMELLEKIKPKTNTTNTTGQQKVQLLQQQYIAPRLLSGECTKQGGDPSQFSYLLESENQDDDGRGVGGNTIFSKQQQINIENTPDAPFPFPPHHQNPPSSTTNTKKTAGMNSVRKNTTAPPPNTKPTTTTMTSPLVTNNTMSTARQLKAYLPPKLLPNFISAIGGNESIFQWQVDCLNTERGEVLDGRRNLLVCAPTGSGKTLIGDIIMMRHLDVDRRKCLLVLPYVALCKEKADRLEKLLQPTQREVVRAFGSYHTGGIDLPQAGVIVATPENANGIVNKYLEGPLPLAAHISCVVIDEIHMVSEAGRGATLELLISKIMFAGRQQQQQQEEKKEEDNEEEEDDEHSKQRRKSIGTTATTTTASTTAAATATETTKTNNNSGSDHPIRCKTYIQFIGMSATLANPDLAGQWLNAKVFRTDFRPVQLSHYMVMRRSGEVLNENLQVVRNLTHASPQKEEERSVKDPSFIHKLIGETVSDGHGVIVFCGTKNNCRDGATKLGKEIVIPEQQRRNRNRFQGFDFGSDDGGVGPWSATQEECDDDSSRARIVRALKELKTPAAEALVSLVPQGIAFHNSNLNPIEREYIERGFRSGAIQVLFATNTLAAGVNLPARRIIFKDHWIGTSKNLLSKETYMQMAGRAGRTGMDTVGEAYMLTTLESSSEKHCKQLLSIASSNRKLTSTLGNDQLIFAKLLLEGIATGTATKDADIMALLKSTLLCHNTEWKDLVAQTQATFKLLRNETLQKESGLKSGVSLIQWNDATKEFRATKHGRAMVECGLPLSQTFQIYDQLTRAKNSLNTQTNLQIALMAVPELEESIPFSLPQWSALVGRCKNLIEVDQSALTFHGYKNFRAEVQYRRGPNQIYKRVAMAFIVRDLIAEMPSGGKELDTEEAVRKEWKLENAKLQELIQATARTAAKVAIFAERIGSVGIAAELNQFRKSILSGLNSDVVPLCDIKGVNPVLARVLYNKNIQEIVQVAKLTEEELAKIIRKNTNYRHNGDKTKKDDALKKAHDIIKEARKLLGVVVMEEKEEVEGGKKKKKRDDGGGNEERHKKRRKPEDFCKTSNGNGGQGAAAIPPSATTAVSSAARIVPPSTVHVAAHVPNNILEHVMEEEEDIEDQYPHQYATHLSEYDRELMDVIDEQQPFLKLPRTGEDDDKGKSAAITTTTTIGGGGGGGGGGGVNGALNKTNNTDREDNSKGKSPTKIIPSPVTDLMEKDGDDNDGLDLYGNNNNINNNGGGGDCGGYEDVDIGSHWACPVCTYINVESHLQCFVCHSEKPAIQRQEQQSLALLEGGMDLVAAMMTNPDIAGPSNHHQQQQQQKQQNQVHMPAVQRALDGLKPIANEIGAAVGGVSLAEVGPRCLETIQPLTEALLKNKVGIIGVEFDIVMKKSSNAGNPNAWPEAPAKKRKRAKKQQKKDDWLDNDDDNDIAQKVKDNESNSRSSIEAPCSCLKGVAISWQNAAAIYIPVPSDDSLASSSRDVYLKDLAALLSNPSWQVVFYGLKQKVGILRDLFAYANNSSNNNDNKDILELIPGLQDARITAWAWEPDRIEVQDATTIGNQYGRDKGGTGLGNEFGPKAALAGLFGPQTAAETVGCLDPTGASSRNNSLARMGIGRVAQCAMIRAAVARTMQCMVVCILYQKDALKALDAVNTIELPLVPVIYDMEAEGIAIDIKILKSIQPMILRRMKELQSGLIKYSKGKYNGDQRSAASFLFDGPNAGGLGLPLPPGTTKTAKNNISTGKHVLECMRDMHTKEYLHPAIPMIIQYRKLKNARSEIVSLIGHATQKGRPVILPRSIGGPTTETGCYRVSGHILQTGTGTGRLAMDDPNFQNVTNPFIIPVRPFEKKGNDGTYNQINATTTAAINSAGLEVMEDDPSHIKYECNIRRAFVASRPDTIIVGADYRQIELRLMAHFSRDEEICKLLRQTDHDPFVMLAHFWKKVQIDKVKPQDRVQAKELCYAVFYGLGDGALADKLQIPIDEAMQIRIDFLQTYSGISSFLDHVKVLCRTNGYIEMMGGRRRPIREAKSTDMNIAAKGERMAGNSVMQGSAADLIKIAMSNIMKRCATEIIDTTSDNSTTAPSSSACRMLLQIHDELLFEVEEKHLQQVLRIIKECMEGAKKLLVPIPVRMSVGPSWGELKEVGM